MTAPAAEFDSRSSSIIHRFPSFARPLGRAGSDSNTTTLSHAYCRCQEAMLNRPGAIDVHFAVEMDCAGSFDSRASPLLGLEHRGLRLASFCPSDIDRVMRLPSEQRLELERKPATLRGR